jgi:hypothetical protein
MPFDVVAYADRQLAFPQQSTGDQFFDEAQWESYHSLGHVIGGLVTESLIETAINLTARDQPLRSSLDSAMKASRKERVATRRERATATVRTSIGIGVVLSVFVAAWQGYQQFTQMRRADAAAYAEDLKRVRALVDAGNVDSILNKELEALEAGKDTYGYAEEMQDLRDRLARKCEEIASRSVERGASCKQAHLVASLPAVRGYWMEGLDSRGAVSSAASQVASAVRDPILPSPPVTTTTTTTTSTTVEPATPVPTPVPTPPPPTAAASTTTATTPACGAAEGEPVRLFAHIYDEDTRVAADALVAGLDPRAVRVMGVENVVLTATRKGSDTPYVWKRPTLIFHGGISRPCQQWLVGKLSAEGRELPKSFRGSAGAVELWLPPRWVPSVK